MFVCTLVSGIDLGWEEDRMCNRSVVGDNKVRNQCTIVLKERVSKKSSQYLITLSIRVDTALFTVFHSYSL